MQTFLTWIDWGENEILRWARVVVISAFGLLLILGVIVLIVSLLRISVWPSVTVDDDIATIRFADSGLLATAGAERTSPQRTGQQSEPFSQYRDEINAIVENLAPICVSLKMDVERAGIEKYVHDRIETLQRQIALLQPSDVDEGRLEAAVEDMVEYVEEMTGYYTEVIEDGEDLIALKSLTERMQAPLQHYEEAFTNAVRELARQSETEKLRVEVLRAQGLAGFWTLGVIGILIISGVPLLVLFRVDTVLRARLDNS